MCSSMATLHFYEYVTSSHFTVSHFQTHFYSYPLAVGSVNGCHSAVSCKRTGKHTMLSFILLFSTCKTAGVFIVLLFCFDKGKPDPFWSFCKWCVKSSKVVAGRTLFYWMDLGVLLFCIHWSWLVFWIYKQSVWKYTNVCVYFWTTLWRFTSPFFFFFSFI